MKTQFVASYNHKPNRIFTKENWVFVDPDEEAADIYILNHIKRGDLLITDDIGFASLALPKGAYVLSSRGKEYKEDMIELSLQFRYEAAKDRRRGNYGKGPRPFTNEDRERFIRYLRQLVSKVIEM